eukprot:1153792-Pleurochrysis_carterae.AAC.2
MGRRLLAPFEGVRLLKWGQETRRLAERYEERAAVLRKREEKLEHGRVGVASIARLRARDRVGGVGDGIWSARLERERQLPSRLLELGAVECVA